MKAIILAAGYGTRLYPLTLNQPKSLLDIGDKKVIDFIIDKIPKEIKEIDIITNAKFYPFFEKWLEENSKQNINLINDLTTSELNKLGAVKDIYLAHSKGSQDDALVLLSDNLFDFRLDEAYDFSKIKNKDVILAYDLQDKSKASRFGVINTDRHKKIIKFEEKPKNPETSLISTGIYFFKNDSLDLILEYLKENQNKDGSGNYVKWLSRKKDVYALISKGRWYDIGTHETYKEVLNVFCKKQK